MNRTGQKLKLTSVEENHLKIREAKSAMMISLQALSRKALQ